MIETLKNIDSKTLSALIGGLFSFGIFILGWLFKVFYDRYTLSFKLKKEFYFEQKKNIKQEISKMKTPLLNCGEELNYRLWNFIPNVSENWHSISEDKWTLPEHYYLRSYVYRLLVFFNWILKIEKSLTHFDSTIADKKDINYLMYIKTFKNIFCDLLILKDLNYSNTSTDNHFFKDDLHKYSDFLKGENEGIIDFNEFSEKLKTDYSDIKKVFSYINEIRDNENDKNLNVIRCFHLILINFLTVYGHEYQQTNNTKLDKLIDEHYCKIKIKTGFIDFLKRNKLEVEMKYIIAKLNKSA